MNIQNYMEAFGTSEGVKKEWETRGRAGKYDVAQHPQTKLWHVIGYAGRNKRGKAQYLPVSSGFKTKEEAQKRIGHQERADKAAEDEVKAI